MVQMESLIPIFSSFLAGNNARNIPLVSSDWLYSFRENEMQILEGLWRTYPSSTTYGSIMRAIIAQDIIRISSLANNYISYLPIQWYHVLSRMLWRDIPVNRDTQIIAYMIFERTLQELIPQDVDLYDVNLNTHIMDNIRFFAFKFETGDIINRVEQIDSTDFMYDGYQNTEEYIQFSQNIPAIASNRIEIYHDFPHELTEIVVWALTYNRIDILQYLYQQDRNILYNLIDYYMMSESECLFRKETIEWLQSIGIMNDACTYILSDGNSGRNNIGSNVNIYRTDALNLVRSMSYLNPRTYDLALENPHALVIYLSSRDNIEKTIQYVNTLTPEIYLMMIDGLNKEDPLFWQIIAHASRNNVPEILEKYIITDLDAEKAKIVIGQINPSTTSGKFFTYEWYKFRREILSGI